MLYDCFKNFKVAVVGRFKSISIFFTIITFLSVSSVTDRVFLACGDSIMLPQDESVSRLRFKDICDVDTETDDDAGCMLIKEDSDYYKNTIKMNKPKFLLILDFLFLLRLAKLSIQVNKESTISMINC